MQPSLLSMSAKMCRLIPSRGRLSWEAPSTGHVSSSDSSPQDGNSLGSHIPVSAGSFTHVNSLNPHGSSRGGTHLHPHFTEEKTKALQGRGAGLESLQVCVGTGKEFEPGLSVCKDKVCFHNLITHATFQITWGQLQDSVDTHAHMQNGDVKPVIVDASVEEDWWLVGVDRREISFSP